MFVPIIVIVTCKMIRVDPLQTLRKNSHFFIDIHSSALQSFCVSREEILFLITCASFLITDQGNNDRAQKPAGVFHYVGLNIPMNLSIDQFVFVSYKVLHIISSF